MILVRELNGQPVSVSLYWHQGPSEIVEFTVRDSEGSFVGRVMVTDNLSDIRDMWPIVKNILEEPNESGR